MIYFFLYTVHLFSLVKFPQIFTDFVKINHIVHNITKVQMWNRVIIHVWGWCDFSLKVFCTFVCHCVTHPLVSYSFTLSQAPWLQEEWSISRNNNKPYLTWIDHTLQKCWWILLFFQEVCICPSIKTVSNVPGPDFPMTNMCDVKLATLNIKGL